MTQIIKDIYPDKAIELIEKNKGNPDFVLLDVRTPMEFRQGRLKGSVLLDMYSHNFIEKVKALEKDKIYLIYCRTGARSSSALDIFSRLNFREAYNLLGGITYWEDQGLPVE